MLSHTSQLPWEKSGAPCVMAPPHLHTWSKKATDYLARQGMEDVIAFATSGSSGSPPKAILFTRKALNICASGAIEHLGAQGGDWCCPLPIWHVGGAMIYLRAALAGTHVHTLQGKWNPLAFATLMAKSAASWASLVPTQVVDLVCGNIHAPDTVQCIIVGGGALHEDIGRKARQLGWPVVQSYGMTESGSQLATAFPDEPFHTDNLAILPHWETKTDPSGILSFKGEGKLMGRLLTQPNDDFLLERTNECEWWQTRDLVHLNGNKLTFLRRADRLIKILGELIDPDAVQDKLRVLAPDAVVEAIPHPRSGMELVACSSLAQQLQQACKEWNATAPGPQRIKAMVIMPIPLTIMGKLDRKQLQAHLLSHPEQRRSI